MVILGATRGKPHVLHTAGCREWVFRTEGEEGAHSEQLKEGGRGGLEEGDRGGPNMTHVSVF